MGEVVNTNLEKLFFAKILDDATQFYKVEPFFFRNEQIRFVYEIIRDNYLNSKDKIVPSPKQIWTMISTHDTEKIVTKEAFKSLLTENTTDVSPEWLDLRYKAWKSSNHTRNKVVDAIDMIKKMEDVDYDNVMDVVQRLETNLIEELIGRINAELENKDTLVIELLAESISIMSAEKYKPMMYMTSRYEVK